MHAAHSQPLDGTREDRALDTGAEAAGAGTGAAAEAGLAGDAAGLAAAAPMSCVSPGNSLCNPASCISAVICARVASFVAAPECADLSRPRNER